MSYRNDHDAALARVDALELENARLAGENAKLRDPAPATVESSVGKKATVVFGGAATSITVAILALVASSGSPKSHHDKAAAAAAHVTHVDLASCAVGLAAKPELGPKTTDPHDPASFSVDQITRTTGCRDEIRQALDEGVISDVERYVLTRWLAAEDDLANRVSLITTYYANDPYALDGYSSAPQLWSEYDKAYEHRQAALEEWRHVVR